MAGFYRDADVGLVTPLRDGMNLVAKEFVACRVREPGVLVLSPFAGAGEMMHEALKVNPYEIGNVANVLHRALTMPREEREVRMHALRYDVLYKLDISFLECLDSVENKMQCIQYPKIKHLIVSHSARERINDVNLWMKSFLKNIGTLIEEDGEDVLPTQMQPLSIEDFDDYLSP